MYAIIKTGGKQFRVAVGDIIDVELLELLESDSNKIEFKEVLFTSNGSENRFGTPSIENFFVYGEVIGQVAGEKVRGLKYKPSHNQCREWGHRQKYTRVKITGIGSSNDNNNHNHKRG